MSYELRNRSSSGPIPTFVFLRSGPCCECHTRGFLWLDVSQLRNNLTNVMFFMPPGRASHRPLLRGGAVVTEHDLAKKAERALFAIVLSTATLIMCVGLLMFR